MTTALPSFTCPRCGRTSYHPTDRAEGYCGACHDWTGLACPCGYTAPNPAFWALHRRAAHRDNRPPGG